MDWEATREHALGALSKAEMGEARVHYGIILIMS